VRNLKLRFAGDRVYTNIGSILVAMNPFRAIAGLYTPVRIHSTRGLRA
jgi:myosin heavy subunit